MTDHKDRAHALLSASGAHRWLICSRSARLEEQFPDEDSPYALEGTQAHEIAEIKLKQKLGKIISDSERKRLKTQNSEMDDYTDSYVERCLEVAKGADLVMLETRVDYSEYAPDGFGTCDYTVLAVKEQKVTIRDLKYGKGVAVSAIDNEQMRLYALGVINEYDWLCDIKEITMQIDQPRLDSVSSETLSVDELKAWGDSIKDKALQAFNGEGEFVPGEHCKFCRARARCRARFDYINDALRALKKEEEL